MVGALVRIVGGPNGSVSTPAALLGACPLWCRCVPFVAVVLVLVFALELLRGLRPVSGPPLCGGRPVWLRRTVPSSGRFVSLPARPRLRPAAVLAVVASGGVLGVLMLFVAVCCLSGVAWDQLLHGVVCSPVVLDDGCCPLRRFVWVVGCDAAAFAPACGLPQSWLGTAAAPLAFAAPTSWDGLVVAVVVAVAVVVVVVVVVAVVVVAIVSPVVELGCDAWAGWLPVSAAVASVRPVVVVLVVLVAPVLVLCWPCCSRGWRSALAVAVVAVLAVDEVAEVAVLLLCWLGCLLQLLARSSALAVVVLAALLVRL